jgi:hypothetical protein
MADYDGHLVTKIWPTGAEYASTPIHGPFSIHFISEGYKASEKQLFINECTEHLLKLIKPFGVAPFSLLSDWNWATGFAAFAHFVPSDDAVPIDPITIPTHTLKTPRVHLRHLRWYILTQRNIRLY